MPHNTFETFQFNGKHQAYEAYDPEYIIAGDTDSAYIDLSKLFDKDADKEEVISFSDTIGEEVNDSFPNFMKEVFNVPDDRLDIIQTDREVVSDKSYFLAKKMYVMHVIDQEGKPVDKLKMMGVSIKKTDTPKVVQALLKGLVERLMDRETYEDISLYIDNFKKDYYEMDLMTIGKPISVKSLTKYQMKYETQQTMKGFPYHVRASMFYNEMCGDSDIKITSNDKVRIIYIDHPKYKYIALPVDADVLPEFTESLVVNWTHQWGTVMKKVNIFLKPINYDRDGRQQTLTKILLRYKK